MIFFFNLNYKQLIFLVSMKSFESIIAKFVNENIQKNRDLSHQEACQTMDPCTLQKKLNVCQYNLAVGFWHLIVLFLIFSISVIFLTMDFKKKRKIEFSLSFS